MMLDRFRIERDGAGPDWPAVIAERSDGWPQHLHNGMRSLGFELLGTEGRLVHVNADAVKAKEREYRLDAYGGRLSDGIRGAKHLIARLMLSLDEGGDSSDIDGRIGDLARSGDGADSRGWRLPKGNGRGGFQKASGT